ncbi:hypothetical protein MKEN_00837700 [Mycena kentingensis (nom. inval.)]|nr:hypothetical protein MKEN_00837700 [Mycena kentingensis (nom. inval.)]
MQELPLELIQAIVAHIDDPVTLKTCAVASSCLTEPAQRNLFHFIRSESIEFDSLERLTATFCGYPRLAAFVRSLRVTSHSRASRVDEAAKALAEQLPRILDALPQLQILSLTCEPRSNGVCVPLQHGLIEWFCGAKLPLREVHLSSFRCICDSAKDFQQLLASLGSLHSLAIVECTLSAGTADRDDPLPDIPPANQLKIRSLDVRVRGLAADERLVSTIHTVVNDAALENLRICGSASYSLLRLAANTRHLSIDIAADQVPPTVYLSACAHLTTLTLTMRYMTAFSRVPRILAHPPKSGSLRTILILADSGFLLHKDFLEVLADSGLDALFACPSYADVQLRTVHIRLVGRRTDKVQDMLRRAAGLPVHFPTLCGRRVLRVTYKSQSRALRKEIGVYPA